MKKNKSQFVLILALLFAFSYLLNFVWESFHAVFLFNGHNFEAIRYVPMIGYVSMVDGLLIVGMYLIVFILSKDLLWIKDIDKKKTSMFVVAGLIIAAVIEYRAIFLLNKWSYNS